MTTYSTKPVLCLAQPCPRCGGSLTSDGNVVWCTNMAMDADEQLACAYGLDRDVYLAAGPKWLRRVAAWFSW